MGNRVWKNIHAIIFACNERMNFIFHLNNDNALLIGNGGK